MAIDEERNDPENPLAPPQKSVTRPQGETESMTEKTVELGESERSGVQGLESGSEGSVEGVRGSEGTNSGPLHDDDVTNKPDDLTSKPVETTQPEKDGQVGGERSAIQVSKPMKTAENEQDAPLKDGKSRPTSQSRKPQKAPTARTLGKIRVAATLRAAGVKWKEVAPQVGRKHANSAVKLQNMYPEEWDKAFEEAVQTLITDVEPLALEQLKKDLKDSEGKVRVAAARGILAHLQKVKYNKVEVKGKIDHEHYDTGMEDWEKDEIRDVRDQLRLERTRQKDRVGNN